MGGAQLLSASVSWAPTAGGHTARQPLPSPSHLESTHETHAARRGLAAGRGRCEKRTSHAPLAHARASPGEVGSIQSFQSTPQKVACHYRILYCSLILCYVLYVTDVTHYEHVVSSLSRKFLEVRSHNSEFLSVTHGPKCSTEHMANT